MILSPRCKLSIFGEKTWSDTDPEPYAQGCRRRLELDYIPTAIANLSSSHGIKPPAPNEDDEFLALFAERGAQRSGVHDYDRYANLPNDPTIKSTLGWWRGTQGWFLDLAKMAGDTSAVPASCCSVERMFSVSGRIVTWQRSHLWDSTLSDLMMYCTRRRSIWRMQHQNWEKKIFWPPKCLVKFPAVEQEQEWWKRKLRRKVCSEIMDRFRKDNESMVRWYVAGF